MGSYSNLQPARRYVAVTKSDTVNLAPGCIGFYVGGTGNVAVVGDDDAAVTLTAPALGVVHWMAVKRINSTNTTATLIVALY